MPEQIEVQMRLVEIEDISFTMNPAGAPTVESLATATFPIDIGTRLDVLTEQKKIAITMAFNFRPRPSSAEDKSISVPFLHYEGMVTYHVIEGIDFEKGRTSKKVDLPNEFIVSLASAAYATFRGIIFSKCGASHLRHILLPLASPDMLRGMMHLPPMTSQHTFASISTENSPSVPQG